MNSTQRDIQRQPDLWRSVIEQAAAWTAALPDPGQRVAVLGAGTSFHIGHSYATARERGGHGETDAIIASEALPSRDYDALVVITRSGTTTDLRRALAELAGHGRTVVITADPDSPVAARADALIALPEAGEPSVVQTCFATTVLAGLLAHLGHDLAPAVEQAERFTGSPLPVQWSQFDRFVFLGAGEAQGIAHEAALKVREMAGMWTESYTTMEYLHGPISAGSDRSLVWLLTPTTDEVVQRIEDVAQTVVRLDAHPLAQLVLIQRLGVELADRRGRDVDAPPFLTRAVELSGWESA